MVGLNFEVNMGVTKNIVVIKVVNIGVKMGVPMDINIGVNMV